jgi:resolvase-like protein
MLLWSGRSIALPGESSTSLHADETLHARGAAIVCVEQSIDMTTGEGRAFAQMLAMFGEMEASAISLIARAAAYGVSVKNLNVVSRLGAGWPTPPEHGTQAELDSLGSGTGNLTIRD